MHTTIHEGAGNTSQNASPHTTQPPLGMPAPTSLAAVLAFSFLNSLGTGVVTSGIFYVTKQGYSFSDRANFLLGIVLGVTYIVGALGAGPALRAIKRATALSDRTLLTLLMLLLAALCVVPWVTKSFATEALPMGPIWPIWIMVGIYSALTGVLWPMVESFLTGGRSPAQQRSALGVWNVVWSSALVLAYCAISPFLSEHAPQIIAVLGAMHIFAAICLVWFPSNAPAHVHASNDEPHTVPIAREKSLLAVFRVLLPLSYVLSSALSPYLAGLLKRLDVGKDWHTVIASVWLFSRVFAFGLLHVWRAWYGTLAAPVVGVVLVLLGFAACTIASQASGTLAVSIIVGGLALFGMGMGTIYTGAISYAMRVGNAEVDAGGTHEALIGVGYLLGPACGLIALMATPSPSDTANSSSVLSFDRLVLVFTLVIVGVLLALAVRAGVRAARAPQT
jgi:hypothetical protein